jgi:hypothetical protein
MRRDAPACRPPSPERGAGNSGSAAQNLPRFSSVATTAPAGPLEALPTDLPEAFPDFPDDLPDDLPVDLRGELT